MAPHLFARFETILLGEVEGLVREGDLPEGLQTGGIAVEPPREAAHGDIACNVAMVLAKPAKKNPREIATALAARLAGRHGIASAEVAGPGFLNLRLTPEAWQEELHAALAAGQAYGALDLGGGEKVNIEYVSANPTGPLHVGHCRGAVVGDALAGLLARAGYAVTREYYINDAGAQVDALARSAHLRYLEALGEPARDIPSGLYPGAYLVPVGEALAQEHGDRFRHAPEAEWLAVFRAAATEAMMETIRADLTLLGIRHDVFFSERSLKEGDDRIAAAIETLRARDLIYEGRLPPPKGQPAEDWEDREQTLFRATRFGDDVDRPLMKSDGSYTYFASDIAYHFDKFARGFANMIDVWGADHAGYVKRMKAAVAALTEGEGTLDIKICQLVRLFRGGEPVKMSKRAGDFVTLRDVVEEVGPDPVRFMMLYRKNDAPLDFDFVAVTERSRDNPVFYVQYAHARTQSVLRNARADLPEVDTEHLNDAPLDCLTDEADLALIRQIANYPRIVELSARHHEPHRLAFYLNDLAGEFHALWNRGKELPHLRFIQLDDIDTSRARLALVSAVAYVLHSGLGVLGVSAPDEMR